MDRSTGTCTSVEKTRYYRRSCRRGGRVTSVYIGGVEGHLAAALAVERRRRRQIERDQHKQRQAIWENASRPLDELDHGLDLLLKATLLAAGCYQNKATWRIRRGYRR